MTIFNAIFDVAVISLLVCVLIRLSDGFESVLERITVAASKAFAPTPDVGTGSPYRDAPPSSNEAPAPKPPVVQDTLAPPCPVCKSVRTSYVPCSGNVTIADWCTLSGSAHAHVSCANCGSKHAYKARVKA